MVAMASPSLNKIETAHQMYRDRKHEEALGFYTEALSLAKTKPQKIALHSNRAACYLKLHDFKRAAEECTSVLELDHKHTGALMLRAQTLVTLKEYTSALFDVNRLIELNPSSEVYRNLEARLRTQLSLAPIPESDAEFDEEEESEAEAFRGEEKLWNQKEDAAILPVLGTDQKTESDITGVNSEVSIPTTPSIVDNPAPTREKKSNPIEAITAEVIAQARRKTEPRKTIAAEVIAQAQRKVGPKKAAIAEVISEAQGNKKSSEQQSNGWQAIPKPKGHSALDYARWDKVEDDSSEEEDEDDDEDSPQYRFRVRTVGVKSVK